MRKFLVLVVCLLMLFGIVVFSGTFDRTRTLYIGGNLWAPPSNWNPLTPWAAVTGTIGLVYEPLFLYDPLTDKFEPWLAESVEWINDKIFQVKLRKNLNWQDGEPLTLEDVIFTFEVAKERPISYGPIWNWLEKIEKIDDYTINFVFTVPHYHEWRQNLYQIAILPKHIWENKTDAEMLQTSNEYPVASGPYYVESWSDDRVVYRRNDDWWGNNVFGRPKPERIVILRVLSNNVAVNMLMNGGLDWSNFFLAGIPALKKNYGLVTWYDEKPYMLEGDLVGIFFNINKQPLYDKNLRRAIAFAIDVGQIIQKAFENMAIPANPVGIRSIPGWKKFYPEDVVAKYGFKYDPEMAKKILDESGYKDVDGDGFREDPNGNKFKLSIECPYGWTDFMISSQTIADNLRKIGINAEHRFVDVSKYNEDLYRGNFDIILNNYNGVTSTIWTHFNYVFYPDAPNVEYAYSGNFGRYTNPNIRELLDQLNLTKDDTKIQETVAKLSEILLTDMPYVPLWFNGAWFQASEAVWENWPNEHNPYAWPITWPNHWQLGSIKVILNIQPKK